MIRIQFAGSSFPVLESLAQRVHKCPNCGLERDRDTYLQ